MQQKRWAWAFLAPSILLYLAYVIFPIFYTFYLSLTDWDGLSFSAVPMCWQSEELSCLENYFELLEDDVFWTSLLNNLIWLVGFGLSPLLGLSLALIFHVKSPLASFYKSLMFIPMVFSLVVVGLIWGWFLQPEFGLVEHGLHAAGILPEEQQFGMMASFSWATAGLILAASWPHAAYCMVLYLAGLSNLDKSVLEAAALDGASRRQILWHMILPMLKPATVIVMIVTMIGALRAFELVAIMTAGGPANSSNVLAYYMYEQTFQNYRYGYGSAIAVVLFLLSALLIALYMRQTRVEATSVAS